ncbi:MAG: excinuclease ABC subunit UvrA [Bacteroidales bacterium]|nr:excinuclease ABC subunit UvrA [Bacteroidales bacterium]
MIEEYINIIRASENNLKEVSLCIPKHKITVFTGISGSGKSSLCLDTIAAESRRELNETFPSFVQQYLPKYGRPKVERIEQMPVTIVIDQKKPASNSRSTVATYTDIYALLRLLFSRVGKPFIGYSDTFSFNHPSGSCPRCAGLGEIRELDIHKLVDFDKSLNDEDTIHYIAFGKGGWRWIRYAYSGLFDLDKKIKDYTPEELDLFLNSPQIKLKNPPSNWPKSAKYEGLIPRMYRSIINSEEGLLHASVLNPMLTMGTCPDCGGTRLNERVRSCKIDGKSLVDVMEMSIDDTLAYVQSIEHPLAVDIKRELSKRLQALVDIGLGYLSLGRSTSTLSGGEAQRIKIARYINSPLTDMAYVLDEPSVGLHPQDIARLKRSLLHLRDHGNTVLIVEHHREIISMADHIVDMGPGAGNHGGTITYEGDYDGLLKSDTTTGRMLRHQTQFKPQVRKPQGWYEIERANLHNLKDLTLQIPKGVMTVIAGVAGSGKSSLMDYFISSLSHSNIQTFTQSRNHTIIPIFIGQHNIGINLRSTPATYLNISDTIRKLFAKASGKSMQLFSFNSAGACPACNGKGIIVSDMAFMESIETECEVCHGTRYNDEALSHKYRGKTIAEVMDMSVDEAREFFDGQPFQPQLEALSKVGLGYLHMNQSMTTLSGGELQRIKLADNLYRKGELYIIDEPTDGLHLDDIQRLMALFDEMTDRGNTLILIEHSLDVMKNADYLVELGPGGGANGGHLLYAGEPKGIMACDGSVTRKFL